MGERGRLAEAWLAAIPSQRRKESGADIAGVERTRDRGVFCAFENGSAISENGHLVRFDTKTEQEFVVADVGNSGSEPLPQRPQVKGASALMNLHGIAAA